MPHMPLIAAFLAFANAGPAAELPVKSNFTGTVLDEVLGYVLRDSQAVEIIESPADSEIAAVIKAVASHRSKWRCRVALSGKLEKCKLEYATPQIAKVAQFKRLVEQVVVDNQTAYLASRKGRFIILDAYLANGNKDEFESCPAGWCPRTMPPPATRPTPIAPTP